MDMRNTYTSGSSRENISAERLVMAAMFAALTFVATSVIKLSTPTFGYIHLGDCFVLLSGILLGPVMGGLAAGIGSALADLLGGYALWVPGTFVIKMFTASVAAIVYGAFTKNGTGRASLKASVPAGIAGEAVMVFGYFLYNIFVIAVSGGGFKASALIAAAAASLAEIPFNVVQGTAGIVLASALLPILVKVTDSLARHRA